MSKDNFKKQKRLTQEEIDAIDNYGKPLKPLPELPSGGMGGKKGGVVKKKIIKAQIGKYMNEDKQKEKYRKRLQEYQEQQEVSRMPRSRSDEGYISDADENYAREMMPTPRMKKGGKINTHKMPGGKMMKDSDMKKKMMNKGGMVRGQGIAIKGTKFKGIF